MISRMTTSRRTFAGPIFPCLSARAHPTVTSFRQRRDYAPYDKPAIWTGDYTAARSETAIHNNFLFTGQLYDPETGLYHYKARALHPHLGRLLQRECLEQPSNLYAYALLSTISWKDTPAVALKAGHGEIKRHLYITIRIKKAKGRPCPTGQSVKKVCACQYVHTWGEESWSTVLLAG